MNNTFIGINVHKVRFIGSHKFVFYDVRTQFVRILIKINHIINSLGFIKFFMVFDRPGMIPSKYSIVTMYMHSVLHSGKHRDLSYASVTEFTPRS